MFAALAPRAALQPYPPSAGRPGDGGAPKEPLVPAQGGSALPVSPCPAHWWC